MPVSRIAIAAGLLLLPMTARADTLPPAAPAGVTVTGVTLNNVPTITGTPPATAQKDTPYSFVPTAQDLDGDALSFSIENPPSWASFDTGNGALTGTPAGGDGGATTGIVISVSDGAGTAALPAFTVTVLPTEVVISWPANPTTDQVTAYGVRARNTGTSQVNEVTVTVAGAAPDLVAAGGTYTYRAGLAALGMDTPGTYEISIQARNALGSSDWSSPATASF